MADPTDPIPNTSGISPAKRIPGEEEEETNSNRQSFASYMNPGSEESPSSSKVAQGEEMSPFDLASQGQSPTHPPTMDSVLSQMESGSSILGDLQSQLEKNKDKLKLVPKDKYKVRTWLNTANANIRSAAQEVGVNPGELPNTAMRQSPVEKFLSLIGDSQVKLDQTKQMVADLKQKNGMISPGALLNMQVTLSRAQQELEYSSILLSKAVDGVKQMFNIQI